MTGLRDERETLAVRAKQALAALETVEDAPPGGEYTDREDRALEWLLETSTDAQLVELLERLAERPADTRKKMRVGLQPIVAHFAAREAQSR